MKRRMDLIKLHRIDTVIDVGASTGGYGRVMRSIGYKGNIISFEPIEKSYLKLKTYCSKDKKWKAYHYALGEHNGQAVIYISGNYDSSSILEMRESHIKSSPHSKVIGAENIEIRTLDSIFNEINEYSNNILLKVDTQGYEKQVLDGAMTSLPQIKGIQIEMSFEELYSGQMLYKDLNKFIEEQGYTLCLIEAGFCDPLTGKLLQSDLTYYRI